MGTWMVVRVCGSDEEQYPSDCEHRQVLLVDAGDSDEVEHVVGTDAGDLTRSPYTP